MAAQYTELVFSALKGDEGAKRELYRNTVKNVYTSILVSVGDRAVAEELTRKVYSSAFSRLSHLRDGNTFPAWVSAIAVETVQEYTAAASSGDTVVVPTVETHDTDTIFDDSPTIQLDTVVRKVKKKTEPIPKERRAVSPREVALSRFLVSVKKVLRMPALWIAVGVLFIAIMAIIFVPKFFGGEQELSEEVLTLIANADFSDTSDSVQIDDGIFFMRKDGYTKLTVRDISSHGDFVRGRTYSVFFERAGNVFFSCPCYDTDVSLKYGSNSENGEAEYVAQLQDNDLFIIISRYAMENSRLPDRIYFAGTNDKYHEPVSGFDYILSDGSYIVNPGLDHSGEGSVSSDDGQKSSSVPETLEGEFDLSACAFDTKIFNFAGKNYEEISGKFGQGTYNSQWMIYMFTNKIGFAFANGIEYGATAVMTSLDQIIDECPGSLTSKELRTIIGSGGEEFDNAEGCYSFNFTYKDCPVSILRNGDEYTPDSSVTFNAIDLPENAAVAKANEMENYIAENAPADGTYRVLLEKTYEETEYGVWADARRVLPVTVSGDFLYSLSVGDVISLSKYGYDDITVETISFAPHGDGNSIVVNGTEQFYLSATDTSLWEYCDSSSIAHFYTTESMKLLFTSETRITDYTDNRGQSMSDIRSFNGTSLNTVDVTVSGGRVIEATINYHP